MEEQKGPGMGSSAICWRTFIMIALLSVVTTTSAQDFVTPSTNTNIIGVTPNLNHIPDFGLKQQQEPSCIIRPGNESFIMCAYNDLRAADLPSVQGDSWMGVSMSNDAGITWQSRLAPGFLGHPNSLGMGFAADPALVAIPGNSPGLAVLNYIAAFRDSDAGVLAIQRWVEFPQEDQEFWKAEDDIHIIDDGTEGRFIDKPAFYYLVDPISSQGTINENIYVEGETAPVAVSTPTGTLIVVYAVFTGNAGGAKLLLRRSYDNGVNWTNAVKISEEQNEVTGVSITAVGQKFVVVYRRRGDNNQPDAILSAYCSNDGNQKCGKGQEVFQLCPFDQPASGATHRTFSFPWAANDGERFWAFAAHRINPNNTCPPVAGAPGLYEGKPRIVAMSSKDGKTWVGEPGPNVDRPFVIEPRSEGFQVMPVAFGTKGRIDLAWYDTFREEQVGLPGGANDLLINDYSSGGFARVYRKADVYMTRLTANNCSGPANQGCAATIQPSVRVSKFQFVLDMANPAVGQETEAHLPNLPLYASGTLAFNGDYISLATAALREITNNFWVPNSLPQITGGGEVDLSNFTNSEDLFVAWGDNRDVYASTPLPGPTSGGQFPYTPPASPLNPGGPMAKNSAEKSTEESGRGHMAELVAADEPDDDPMLPPDNLQACTPGAGDFSRSRDSNIYSSLVKDQATLVAPTPTKPMGTIQRMFPLVLTNIDAENPKTFCLNVAAQPLDYPTSQGVEGTGLASFYQLPARAPFFQGDELDLLEVEVLAGSSASRAVFVTTSNGESVVDVNAYEGQCPTMPGDPFNGPLISSVQLSDGALFDPVYCSDPANNCDSVLTNETHNISFAAPVLQTPVLQTPVFQTPGFQTPVLQTPVFQTPVFQTPSFQTPVFQTPVFQTPVFQTPVFQTPGFQTPVFQTPSFQTPSFQTNTLIGDAAEGLNGGSPTDIYYQDVTYVVSADANVTTSYAADIALSGLDPDESAVQFIAWTPNTYTTSVDCFAQPIANQQIIAYTDLDAPSLQTVSLPSTVSATDQDPYAGELSFTGSSGKNIALTVRIWSIGATTTQLQMLETGRQECVDGGGGEECEFMGTRQLITFGASAHGCATLDAEDNTQTLLPDCLDNGHEKIFEDKQGPDIDHPGDFTQEASGPSGATVDYVATVSDNNDPNPTLSCAPVSGSLFGLGANTVICDASDNAGNDSNSSFTITVADTTAPTLSALPDITQEATSSSGANVSWVLPIASDIVDPNPEVLCEPGAGSVFAFSPTTVSCTTTDASLNQSFISFVVTVEDTIAPVINPATVPADITVNANVSTGWTLLPPTWALWSPEVSADDDVAGTVVADCTNSSGGDFPLGLTTVTCDATDVFHNTSAPVSFGITVIDQSAPSISLPADVTVLARDASDSDATYIVDSGSSSATVEANLPDPDGARITYNVPASDIVNANPVVTCSPVSGSVFVVGTTPVSCTATDGTNTSDPLVFSITVEDTTEPVFSVMNDVTFSFSADSPGGAYVDLVGDPTIDLHATDRGARLEPDCSATPSGGGMAILLPATLAPGDYDVSCVIDDVTTMAMLTVVVDVDDSVPPVLNVPLTAVQQDADASGSAVVNFSSLVTASDIVDTDVEISCSPASGTAFAVGSHTVTCTANDHIPGSSDAPNETTESFTIVISDVTAPAPPIGIALTEEATSAAGTSVSWLPITSIDSVDGVVTAMCAPASGSTFAIGTTAVACTAMDSAGNSSVGGFSVTVQDTTAPSLPVLSDVTEEATSSAGAVATWISPVATDLVDPAPAVTCTPSSGSTFALGTTSVSCTATDGTNISAASLFNVIVADTTAPVVSAANIEIDVFNAPVNVEINYVADVVVTDAVDPNPVLVCAIDNPGPDATDDGTTIAITNYGSWVANCLATDASANVGNTSFNITVGFPYSIEIARPKGRINAGSTVPVDFRYLSSGTPVNSASVVPVASWVGPHDDNLCTMGNTDAGSGEDSGSSGYRYTDPDWQFNWQTPTDDGYYLFTITPPGLADINASVCVRLR